MKKKHEKDEGIATQKKPGHENDIREEVAKEFQVERIVLFSDAVFAIVITLVAIEIRMPELEKNITLDEWLEHFRHLIPTFVAYAFSFVIIGNIWYRHLKLFAYIKAYDTGLVMRNLLMLFFVGLFPFSLSLLTSGQVFYPPYFIYIFLVLLSTGAQLILTHYVLVKRPALRNGLSVHNALIDLKITRLMFISIIAAISLVVITYLLIPNENKKPFAYWWMMTLPFLGHYYKKRFEKLRIKEAL